jgi:hypothetical protein
MGYCFAHACAEADHAELPCKGGGI